MKKKKCRLEIYFSWDPDLVSRVPINTGGDGEVAMSERPFISQTLDLKNLDTIFFFSPEGKSWGS